ncbi:MAG: hypothetical protein AAB434_11645 [Planctomycetota bacterium]
MDRIVFNLLGTLVSRGILSNNDIEAARTRAGNVSAHLHSDAHSVQEATRKSNEMAEAVGELNLICHALLRILIDKGIITKDDFDQAFHELDASDGVVDGKLSKKRVAKKGETCPACEAKNPVGRKSCMYCDAPLEQKPVKAPEIPQSKSKPKKKPEEPWPPIGDMPELDA